MGWNIQKIRSLRILKDPERIPENVVKGLIKRDQDHFCVSKQTVDHLGWVIHSKNPKES